MQQLFLEAGTTTEMLEGQDFFSVANVMFQMDNTIWFGSFLFLYFLVVVVVIFRPTPRKPILTIAEHVWNVLVVIVDIVVVVVTVVVLLSDS